MRAVKVFFFFFFFFVSFCMRQHWLLKFLYVRTLTCSVQICIQFVVAFGVYRSGHGMATFHCNLLILLNHDADTSPTPFIIMYRWLNWINAWIAILYIDIQSTFFFQFCFRFFGQFCNLQRNFFFRFTYGGVFLENILITQIWRFNCMKIKWSIENVIQCRESKKKVNGNVNHQFLYKSSWYFCYYYLRCYSFWDNKVVTNINIWITRNCETNWKRNRKIERTERFIAIYEFSLVKRIHFHISNVVIQVFDLDLVGFFCRFFHELNFVFRRELP